MSGEPTDNMRERAQLCRRMANHTHDNQVREVLLKMADDIEADLAQILLRLGAKQ